jgi:hypothetical protein
LRANPARESCNSRRSFREFRDLYCRWSAKSVVRFILLGHLKGQPVFSTNAPKVPESGSNSDFCFPEPILATVEMRHKFTALNPYNRLEV